MKPFIYIFFLLNGFTLFAQDDWDNNTEGELEDSQIVIEKNRSLDLPRASRNFLKVPTTDRSQDSIRLRSDWNEITPGLGKLKPKLRVLRIKSEPLPKLFANQVSAGLGNYGATFLSGFVGNKRDRNKSYGVQFYHKNFNRGAVDKKYSGSGYQMIRPWARFFNDKFSVETSLHYDRINNFAYGLEEETLNFNETFERSEFRKTFQTIGADVVLADRKIEDKLNYNYQIGFHHLFGNADDSETLLNFKLNNYYNLENNLAASLLIEGFASNYKNQNTELTINRSLLQFKPRISYEMGDLLFHGGLTISADNNKQAENRLYFLPDFAASYFPLANTFIKAQLRGEVQAVTARELVEVNPYLDPLSKLSNSVKPIELKLSAGTNLFKKIQAEASFSLASIKNVTFFENFRLPFQEGSNYFNSSTFIVDEHIAAFNGIVFLQSDFGSFFNMQLKGEYFRYADGDIDNFPNIPELSINVLSSFNIKDKLEIGLNIYAQSAMDAFLAVRQGTNDTEPDIVEIDAFADLGLSTRYNLTSRASIFLNANNLLANNYQFYLNYPNRGFQVIAGFTYSF